MSYSDITYITGKGVISELSLANLADKVNKPGVITDPLTIANIEGAIARADGLIDSYLRAVYSGDLPLASPPETVSNASAEIAVYLLWESTNVSHDDNPRAEAYDRAMEWLRNLAKGVVVLDLPTGETNPTAGCASNGRYSDRQFSPDTLRGKF
jgi:phage gp36-like protein